MIVCGSLWKKLFFEVHLHTCTQFIAIIEPFTRLACLFTWTVLISTDNSFSKIPYADCGRCKTIFFPSPLSVSSNAIVGVHVLMCCTASNFYRIQDNEISFITVVGLSLEWSFFVVRGFCFRTQFIFVFHFCLSKCCVCASVRARWVSFISIAFKSIIPSVDLLRNVCLFTWWAQKIRLLFTLSPMDLTRGAITTRSSSFAFCSCKRQ